MGLIDRLLGKRALSHAEATGHQRKPWQLAPGRVLTDGCRECVKEAVMADIKAESEARLAPEPRRLTGF